MSDSEKERQEQQRTSLSKSVPILVSGRPVDSIESLYRGRGSSSMSQPRVDIPESESLDQDVLIRSVTINGDIESINPSENVADNIEEPGGHPCVPPGCGGRSHAPTTISYLQRVIAGSGHILNDLTASLWFSYLLLYLQFVVGLSKANAAALMLLGQVVDGLSTPLIGYEADRANHCWLCKKGYGRCKSWHLVGVLLVIFSFPFVFSPCIGCDDRPNAPEWPKVIYYAPFIAIFQIGWASSQISHLALIPKMNHDVLVRTELLAIRYGFTIAANVTVFILTWLTLGFGNCTISPDDATTFMHLGLIAVGVGGFFSLLFHLFVIERTDEEIKKTNSLLDASGEANREQENQDLMNSLTAVTNVRSVASSMAISKVHAQARRRRHRASGASGKVRADREAGQSLLSADQDDIDQISVSIAEDSRSVIPSGMVSMNQNGGAASSSSIIKGNFFSTKSLNVGKENMSLADWLSLPQFYIVAVMYMATRLSVNITQVYMPIFLQETLRLPCGSIATIPLTMYCSGFVVAVLIKLINKYCGRQIAYTLGALLCVTGGALILFLDWELGSDLTTKGIYGVAVLLGGGASAILVTSLSITADMIGNNIENGAFVYGAMSFCDKLSCGLVIMLINSITVPDAEKSKYYQNVLGYSSGGCSAIGILGVIGLTFIIYIQNKRKAMAHFVQNTNT